MATREVVVTVGELANSQGALDALVKAKLPIELSFRLALLVQEVDKPLKAYHEGRNKLMEEHGTPSKDGAAYTFKGEAKKRFADAIEKLEAETLTLRVPELATADLGGREVLSGEDVYLLRWLFTDRLADDGAAGSEG